MILLLLSGCEKKQIFVHKGDQYKLVALTDNELENNHYYVKDGSSFYAVYEPNNYRSKAYWIGEDITLIPDLYENELIAFQSKTLSVSDIRIDRYADKGYTIAIWGIKNNNGTYEFDAKSNIIPETAASDLFKDAYSNEIHIETINGQSPTTYKLTTAGTIEGLELNESVVLGLYEGTVYKEITLTAEVHNIVPYESFTLTDSIVTKQGYISTKMLENARDGYYRISAGNYSGFFRYHNHKKGDCNPDGDNLNISSYATRYDELAELYTQYFVMVAKKTYDIGILVTYADTGEQTSCVIQSPDGELYDIDCYDGRAELNLQEAIPGKWTVNIYPKGTQNVVVAVDTTHQGTASDCVEYELINENQVPKSRILVTYSGSGTVWGTIENVETGVSEFLETDTKTNLLYCDWIYMPVGTYKCRIYHYNDTEIISCNIVEVDESVSGEVIILEDGGADEPEEESEEEAIVIE